MAISYRDGRVSHEGFVIALHSYWNMSMDVDSYSAEVWNRETGKTEHVHYGDNWNEESNPRCAAKVDITEQTAPDYFDYVRACREQQLKNEHSAELARLAKGKTVEVVRGRKVAKGTIGVIFWIGDNGWGESVGIKTSTGDKHFTASKNVSVTKGQ